MKGKCFKFYIYINSRTQKIKEYKSININLKKKLSYAKSYLFLVRSYQPQHN